MVALIFTFLLQTPTATELLQRMHKMNGPNWHKTMTFAQQTDRFSADTLVSSMVWHEAAQFPDLLRIDMGDKKEMNTVIYSTDSTYTIRGGRMTSVTTDRNELINLVGGMYFLPVADMINRFKKYNYDLEKIFESTWKGRKVYGIGARTEGERLNQVWIDKERLVVLRTLRFENNTEREVVFSDHKLMGKVWIENKMDFYTNKKLVMTERYFNVKTNVVLDLNIFAPKKVSSHYWY